MEVADLHLPARFGAATFSEFAIAAVCLCSAKDELLVALFPSTVISFRILILAWLVVFGSVQVLV
jgi:hypothetical protein